MSNNYKDDSKINELAVRLRRGNYSDANEIYEEILKLKHRAVPLVPSIIEGLNRGINPGTEILADVIACTKSEELLEGVEKSVPVSFSWHGMGKLLEAGFHKYEKSLLDFLWELTEYKDSAILPYGGCFVSDQLGRFGMLKETLETMKVIEKTFKSRLASLESKIQEGERRVYLGEMEAHDVFDATTERAQVQLLLDSISKAVVNLGGRWLTDEIEKIGENDLYDNQSIPLKSIISLNECEIIEFKSSLRYCYKENKKKKELEDVVVKAVAGLANHKGGMLCIGISDQKEILGLSKDYETSIDISNCDGFERHLRQILQNKFGSNFVLNNIEIRFDEINNLEVCVLRIIQSDIDLWVNIDSDKNKDKVFFVRNGAKTIPLPNHEVHKYLSSRKAMTLDSLRAELFLLLNR
jgi:hypothetical protein